MLKYKIPQIVTLTRSTVYCDNQPVKILEKGYALALCDVNGKRVYITCYDLEKKPFVSTNGEK